ncbi:MAG: hypothetical protein IJ224_00625 [Lachnospiraceae bacterium]|nr:hypothetical protein [Lachnospiraceae bacterium]
MLKECYYYEQTEYDNVDYIFLHRFLDRMIQYRNTNKGSYDGKNRIEEIKKIDLNKVTYNTKLILLYCIKKHNAVELLQLDNLKELNGIKYRDIDFLERGDKGMKLSIDDFLENIKLLNEAIKNKIDNNELPEDYIFEIKCIGGFAMSYYRLRETGLTEDMDSLIEINEIVKSLIVKIATEKSLPLDWINDTMIHFYTDESKFEWIEIPWFLGKNSRIKIYVCSKTDLLRNKIRFAESYLMKIDNQDRDSEIDYKDTMAILKDFNIGIGTNHSYAKAKLEEMGIFRKDFPEMYKNILGNDYIDDEEYFLFKCINKVNKKEASLREFEELIDKIGYSKEEILNNYSMYLNEYPYFKSLICDNIN